MSSTLFIPLLGRTLLTGLRKGSKTGMSRKPRRKTLWSKWILRFSEPSATRLRFQVLMAMGVSYLKPDQRDEGIKQRCWNSGKSRIQEKRLSTIRMRESETWKWNWLVSRRLCKARTKRSIRPSLSYSMSSQLPTRMRMLETSWSRWWMLALLSSTRMVLWLYLL